MIPESKINSMKDSMAAHNRKASNRCGDTAITRRHFLVVAAGAAGGILLSDPLFAVTAPRDLPYPTIADSVRDFSGVQGYDGWYYGYTVGPYSVGSFQLMSHFLDAGGGNRNWLVDPANYLTRLSADGGYPNGVDIIPNRSSEVHGPVRRWVSPISDKVEISGTLALFQPDVSLDGITGYIYADGRLLWTQALDRDTPSAGFAIEIRVSMGMHIDFVVAPGTSSTGDAFLFNAEIAQGGCRDCCFADPPVRYLQRSLPWGPLTYDHKTPADGDHTIGDVGCALSCLSMGLFYAGFINDPRSLNTLLTNNKGYDPVSHNVHWDDAVRAARRASGKTLVWVPVTTSSPAALEATLCAGQDPTPGVFSGGFPIIVGVQRNASPGIPFKVNHYVLVTGFRKDNPSRTPHFSIIDPGSSQISSLSQYNDRFSARGFVIDPPGELSGLNVDVANANLIVMDSARRKTGFDPAGPITEIPQSIAYIDSLDGDISGTPARAFSSYVSIRQPSAGSYSLRVTGVTGESHTVSIRGYSDDGSAQDEVIMSINAPPGETVTLDLEYSPTPGSVPQITKTVNMVVQSASINPRSKGVIPVAILSTPMFDATEIDPLSVRFGPGGASEAHGRGHIEDTNGDGRADLMLHFRVQESGITVGQTEVCLTGRTRSGTAIRGCAPIRVMFD